MARMVIKLANDRAAAVVIKTAPQRMVAIPTQRPMGKRTINRATIGWETKYAVVDGQSAIEP